jgi:hypothetical protein
MRKEWNPEQQQIKQYRNEEGIFLPHFCMVLFVLALDLMLNMQPKFYTAY